MNRLLCLTLLLGCAITLAGCSEGTDPDIINAIPIIVDDSLYTAAFNTPQAELSIENGVIKQDLLKLSVSFPGGCEQHNFGLLASRGIDKISPAAGFFLLTHDANNDSCNVEMVEELLFDLSPYREYLQLGLVRSGGIKIVLKGFAENLMYEF